MRSGNAILCELLLTGQVRRTVSSVAGFFGCGTPRCGETVMRILPPLVVAAILAIMTSTGSLVAEQDRELRQAAEQGDADAQFRLGDAYFKGEGVEPSQPPRGGVVQVHRDTPWDTPRRSTTSA